MLGAAHVRAYLTHLATKRHVAASTQQQALNAIVFLYRDVLRQPLGTIGPYARTRRPKRLPPAPRVWSSKPCTARVDRPG